MFTVVERTDEVMLSHQYFYHPGPPSIPTSLVTYSPVNKEINPGQIGMWIMCSFQGFHYFDSFISFFERNPVDVYLDKVTLPHMQMCYAIRIKMNIVRKVINQ